MRRELKKAAIDMMLPPIKYDQSALARLKGESKGPESKTTIVAFRYGEGIMCVADRKTTAGYSIFSQRSQKIQQVSHASFLLGCGSVGSIQEVGDRLKARCKSASRSYGIPLSIQGQAKYLAQLCNFIRRYLDGWDFSFGGILAGVSYDGSSHIYAVEGDGSSIDCDDYVADGSGGTGATIALDILWKRRGGRSMDLGQALNLAIEVIYRAADRDIGSSPVQVVHPTAAIITNEGIGVLLPDTLLRLTTELFLADLKAGGTGELPPAVLIDLSGSTPQRKRRKK